MCSTLLELARDIADETGLERPESLFPGADAGDTSGLRIVRATEWLCRYLTRNWNWPEVPFGMVGVSAAGDPLQQFASGYDWPWPDRELVILGAAWRLRAQDGLADRSDFALLDETITDLVWRAQEQAGGRAYSAIDAGMPGWPGFGRG